MTPAEEVPDPDALKCTSPTCFRTRAFQRGYYLSLCWKCRNLLKKKRQPLRYQFNILRKSAKRRGIPFKITFDKWCEWCEQTGYMKVKGRGIGFKSIGRIDHSKGYELDNICVEDYHFNSIKGHEVPGEDLKQNHQECYEDISEDEPF